MITSQTFGERRRCKDHIVLVAACGRSGQSWLCMMLSYLLNATFIEPYCLLRGIRFSEDDRIMHLTAGFLDGRAITPYKLVVKTHELPDRYLSLTSKMIVVQRDPRDAISSTWLRQRTIAKTGSDLEPGLQQKAIYEEKRTYGSVSFKHQVSVFLHSFRKFTIWRMSHKWTNYLKSWEKVPGVYKLKFEALKSNPAAELASICEYLEVPACCELIQETILEFDIKKMRASAQSAKITNAITVRKGEVGDYKNHLSRVELWLIRRICGEHARREGYEL